MLKGKTAVITGGSRGIGRAIAEKFAASGADIAIIDIGDEEILNEAVSSIISAYGVKAKAYRADVSDFNGVKETVAEIRKDFTTADILVNNAGITRDSLIAMMKEEDFDKVIAVNLKGAFNMIRHMTGLFIRNHGGCVINIASVAGLTGNPGQINYSASKAGLIGMTKTVARELASKGVRCNAIAPGFIATDMTKTQEDNPMVKNIPLGRMGSIDDIASTALFLAQAEYVTGEVIRVDGGLAM